MAGPLSGYRIIEMGGIGPGPFAAMMLADHGAEVIRIDRPGTIWDPGDTMLRSRKRLILNLKNPDDVAALRELAKTADALIEGFRPGTMERLGLAPEALLADNPRLVYGRMTGWGQTGPYAPYAGHDLNYISLSGAAHSIGTAAAPVPPLALTGDMGGGGMMLAFSITAALLNAARTGEGQVIDCAMTEGSALLMTAFYGLHATGGWSDEREANLLDGGAPYYRPYRTADGKFVSIGPLEPQFYRELLERLGLVDDELFADQDDRARWPAMRERLDAIFAGRTQAEWRSALEHTDVCFAPVLSMAEAPDHPHNVARGAFVRLEGINQPAPAPRYSRSLLNHPVPPRDVSIAELMEDGRDADRRNR
ncbi:CaiB/BaiF CoA transferase family protein [Sphingobium chlorophenolicum]|uniref:Alpha-methylacyl-CoA racemase n=1 Tax=Sphingobium chlorophenolicum TaxID=46429 RepID=A0A081RA05_SPHCR|nr:CaiB/BaiF CoA-transferase family protein [Sphingobium chlorophenolicum]KEQ52028.1 Alpha-methylacyl-CoA racemase [Sphingobium chlorophenolicum]